MFEKKKGQSFPMLINGLLRRNQKLNFEIISLKERISIKPLSVVHLSKIMFLITNLLRECNHRNSNFLKSLSLDQIYVTKNIENDSHVFIFEEDQQNEKKKQNFEVILSQLFYNLGFNITQETFNKANYLGQINEYLIDQIFEERKQNPGFKITEKHILERIFNLQIIETKYNQPQSRVYIIKTPYYIDSQRDKIAVKWIGYNDQDLDQYLDREIKLLERVHDLDNCTKMFCYNNIIPSQFIFMKYYDITLEELNNAQGKKDVNQVDLMHLIKQMLLALKGLHSRWIIHRDLKPQNIMFEYLDDKDHSLQNMRCVLIDLDRSDNNQIAKSMKVMQSDYTGTLGYEPPEGTQNNNYNESYDIWQIGYIIQCILLRDKNREYSKEKERPIPKNDYDNIFKSDWEKVKQRFPQFYDIVKQMLDHNPEERPSLTQIEDAINKIN